MPEACVLSLAARAGSPPRGPDESSRPPVRGAGLGFFLNLRNTPGDHRKGALSGGGR
jgi:hypothetical protein